MPNDDALLKHYDDAHQDLKTLGLELTSIVGNGSTITIGNQSNVKGKISNTLLTQTLMFSLLHKSSVQDILKDLNDEMTASTSTHP